MSTSHLSSMDSKLFDISSDLLIISSFDGIVIEANDSLLTFLEIEKNDVINQPIFSDWDIDRKTLLPPFAKLPLSDFRTVDLEKHFLLCFRVGGILQDARAYKAAIEGGIEEVIKLRSFNECAKALFSLAKEVSGATAGYVALLSPDGQENDVVFLDPGPYACTVDPTLPMPIRGFRAEAYARQSPIADNKFAHSPHKDLMPPGHVDLTNVMFGPLTIAGKSLGVIGLANSEKGKFHAKDVEIVGLLSRLAAISLTNSRNLDNIQASATKYRSIVDQLQGVGWGIDKSFSPLYIEGDTQKLLGAPKQELVTSKSMLEYIFDDEKDMIVELWAKSLDNKGTQFGTTHRLKNGNGGIWVKQTLCSYDGNQIHGLFVDISATIEAQEKQKQAEKQLNEYTHFKSMAIFSGRLAHYFNNLFTSMLSNVSEVLSHCTADTSVTTMLWEVDHALTRASELTAKLLRFSGQGDFLRDYYSMNTLTTMAVKDIGDDIITVDLGQDVDIWVDRMQFEEIVKELYKNAKENESTSIRVSTHVTTIESSPVLKSGSYGVFTVSDNGKGMDKETQNNLFNPFFSTKVDDSGPIGFGLASSMGYVQGYGGHIFVESQIGEGTKISAYIPIIEERPPNTPLFSQKISGAVTRKRANTVLVVDDEVVVRKVAQRILKRAGFDVILAVDGIDGVEKYKAHEDEIACVLLDLSMPRLDGYGAFSQMTEICESIPIIISSGCDQNECVRRMGGLGSVSGFVPKPYKPSDLLVVVKGVTMRV